MEESYYVIARPPVAVGFEEKKDRSKKTWKMAVVSITAKWIVDQLLTRFKLALGFSNLRLSLKLSSYFEWCIGYSMFPEVRTLIWKPAFENITIFCFKCSKDSLKLTRPMHICLKISQHHKLNTWNESLHLGHISIPSFLAISLSFLELFLQSFPPLNHRFLNYHI